MNINEIIKKEKNKILVADSCAGGVAVLKHLVESFPNAIFTFLADGEKNPFGVKSEKEIINIVEDWLKYAVENSFDILIIACNTASISIVNEISELKNKYKIPIVTMIDALVDACKSNFKLIENNNVALFGTKFTVSSDEYVSIIEKYYPSRIFKLSGTESEKMVANGLFEDEAQQQKVNDEIALLKNFYIDTFILACTCFEFVKELILRHYKNVQFLNLNEMLIDSNDGSSNSLDSYKFENIEFVTTGEIEEWTSNINIIVSKVFKKQAKIKKIKIR